MKTAKRFISFLVCIAVLSIFAVSADIADINPSLYENSVLQDLGQEDSYIENCTKYPSYCEIEITANVNAMSIPCDSSVNSDSIVKKELVAGETYVAVALYLNDNDEYWYELQVISGDPIYVAAGSASHKKDLTNDVLIMEANEPILLELGEDFTIKGSITSVYNTIKAVSCRVYQGYTGNGTTVMRASETVNAKSYNLSDSKISTKIDFSTLDYGKYTYVVDVAVESYYAASATECAVNTNAFRLRKAYFRVSENTVSDYDVVSFPVTDVNAVTKQIDGEVNYYPNNTLSDKTFSSDDYNFRFVGIIICDSSNRIVEMGVNLFTTQQEQPTGRDYQNEFTVPSGGFAITYFLGEANAALHSHYLLVLSYSEQEDGSISSEVYNKTVRLKDNNTFFAFYSDGEVTFKSLYGTADVPEADEDYVIIEEDPDPEIMLGDVNGDESIDTRDYVLVARNYMGTYTLTAEQEARADVNGDTVIDTRDYVLIARHYMGTYTIGE